MAKRYRVNKRNDKRYFSRTASKQHWRNKTPGMARGGIWL